MTKYDIYWVYFLKDESTNKPRKTLKLKNDFIHRPALILSDKTNKTIKVAKITKHSPRNSNKYPGEYVIKDYKKCGLFSPSTIRFNKQITLPIKYITKKLGRLTQDNIDAIQNLKLENQVYLESIEKHNKLNPKLFENNKLKEDVNLAVKDIVNTFEEIIKKDGVKFKIKDIVLVGSNVSYNYTDDSDLDIHIIADSNVLKNNGENSKKYLGLLYNMYKSMFNSDYDITIHGVPAEIYVELDNIGAAKSNGVYSVLNDTWIKEPVQENIPNIDMNSFGKEFVKWKKKYDELMSNISNDTLLKLEEDFSFNESSITRIGRQLEFGNVAILSAYRYNYSDKENQMRQDKLKSIIRNDLKLGYKEFKAKFVGNVEDTGELITSYEYSLFVPNMTSKQAIRLGKQFEQQSVIVKDDDGIREICTTDFIDENGKSFKVGDTIRTFESSGRDFLNINDAIDIFANRVGGSASKPLNIDRPFTLKPIKQKRLESIMEILDPKPSCFQTSKSYVMIYDSANLNEAGYSGYSMSNNAVSAYENGERPLSKWKKSDILSYVKNLNLRDKLKKVSVSVLKNNLLKKSSWHHTSSMYNETDFYSIDEEAIADLNAEKVDRLIDLSKDTEEEPRNIKKGTIKYFTWEGTRAHPKPVEHILKDVNIETKGQFYIVTNDKGEELVRKKIGSTGTVVSFNR